ncbi:hypothetical protein ACLMJK_005197 [Lecanora helva]
MSNSDFPLSLPSLPTNASQLDAKKTFVECDGATYGFNLDLNDCEDARNNVPYKSQQFTFAQRHTSAFVKKKMYPLPHRTMSDKGSCYVDINLEEGQSTGHSSLGQVQIAADAIISRCVKNGIPQGGIAHNIGSYSLDFLLEH